MVQCPLSSASYFAEFGWPEEEPLDQSKAEQVIGWVKENEEGLQRLNKYFEDNSYVFGYTPTVHDKELFRFVFEAWKFLTDTFSAFGSLEGCKSHPHLHRWYTHIATFEQDVRESWTP